MRWIPCLLLLACGPIRVEADPESDLGPTPDVALPDAAVVPVPCLQHSGDIDFGPVRRGERVERLIQLTGCADQTVAISTSTQDVDAADPGFVVSGVGDLTLEAATPPAKAQIRVEFRPQAAGRQYTSTLRLTTTDPERAEIQIELTGSGAWADLPCEPWDVGLSEGDRVLGPGTVVTLRAVPPNGLAREAARVSWRVQNRPAGSVSNPVEYYADPEAPEDGGETDDPTTPEALFFIDEPGVYTFEAVSSLPDSAGCAEQRAQVRLVACPCPGDLQVQLRWRVDPEDPPPVGIRSNLDLHLAHPDAIIWNDPLNDCRSVNPTPDWGVAGLADDDPLLDNDDADAPGIENIFIERLQRSDAIRGAYRIGVEHVRAEWTAIADVEIWFAGEVVWRRQGRVLSRGDEWWEVAALGWYDGALTIIDLDRTYGTRPPLDATLRPGAECLPDILPPCSPELMCLEASAGTAGRCL